MNSLHEYSLTFMSLLIKIFRLGNLLSQEDPLEWKMATCSSILAWEIPETAKSGKLQPTGATELTQLSIYVCTIPCQANGITTRAWVQSLIGELRSCKPHGVAKKKKKRYLG